MERKQGNSSSRKLWIVPRSLPTEYCPSSLPAELASCRIDQILRSIAAHRQHSRRPSQGLITHWHKLNRLPIAPPRSTTSQFLLPRATSEVELGDKESSAPRQEFDSASSLASSVLEASDSRLRYHAISRGKSGKGMVKAGHQLMALVVF